MRQDWKPGNMLYPLPAVLISSGDIECEYNVMTASWVGTVCSEPPMCYVSIRKERYSYEIVKNTREFVINLTTRDMAFAVDWCGVRSGKDYNKFEKMHLTPERSSVVAAPSVGESPVSIECKVRDIIPLGSHDMFLADVVNVRIDSSLIDPKTQKLRLDKACPIAYSHGEYFTLGKFIGKFGWSVKKK